MCRRKLYFRNTKQSIGHDYVVPAYVEDVRYLEFNAVERGLYQTVPSCDTLRLRQLCCHAQISEEDQKVFGHDQKSLDEICSATIQQKLAVDTLSTLFPQLDTIEVKVTVLPDASMQFEPQFPKDSVAYDTIKIDSILHARLIDFPKVNPAIKRGIPVKTQFLLPVIIKQE